MRVIRRAPRTNGYLALLTDLDGTLIRSEDAICEAAVSAAVAQLKAGYPVRMPLSARSPQEVGGQTAVEAAAALGASTRLEVAEAVTHAAEARLAERDAQGLVAERSQRAGVAGQGRSDCGSVGE